MSINLPADLESFIAAEVASGAFPSPDDVLRAAVELLRRENERCRQKDALRQSLQAAIAEADRGELVDVDEAFDEAERELFGGKEATA
jgi:putative addiction module CopG family antidote